MDLGPVVVAVAVIAALIWMGYLLNRGRVGPSTPETPAKNLQPGPSNEHLEGPRLNKALLTAIFGAGVLSVVVPLNLGNNASDQVEAAELREEEYVEFGEHWYEAFTCIECHGPAAGGGAAAYTEARSGLSVSWTAPSLNDVFYRYSDEEVEFWIVYGRAGSPMPASGLAGGGAMTDQEVEQVMEYLKSLQVSQEESIALVDTKVDLALSRIDGADARLEELISEQEARIAEIEAAPALYAEIEQLPGLVADALALPGSCTDASAEIVGRPCTSPGADSDRDGLSDAAEPQLVSLFARAAAALDDAALAIELDSSDPFTGTDAGGDPVADLDAVDDAVTALDTYALNVRLTTERQDVFLSQAEQGLNYLEASAAARAWEIDFASLAASTFGGDLDTARRAAGLYSAYCARCHTAGYSAGVAFESEPGSGAWGPALTDGRSITQFPDIEDQVDFIIEGSELGVEYGINGIGRGWMPGFGALLSEEDIRLIVEFERSL